MQVPTGLHIRAFEDRDHDAWLPLWQGYQRFYRAAIPPETTAVAWQRMVDPAEPTFGALAWQGDHPAGIVHCILHRSNWTVGDYCYLQDLFVAESHRGRGIGRQLIEYAYAQATARGCSRVYWLTEQTNSTAMLLYDRIARKSGFLQYCHSL